VAFKVTRDHEGICWDGLGIPPDLRVVDTPAEIAAGTDRQLEFAQRLLERGAPAPQDETASLTAVRTSLVEDYARGVRSQSVEAAVAALNRARTVRGDTAFFGVEEATQLASQYLRGKQYSAAIGLLNAVRQDYPKVAATYGMLAQAYAGGGDVATAEAALAQGKSVEPMFPFEALQIEQARHQVRKAKLGSAAKIVGQALADGGTPAAEKTLQNLQAQRDTGPVFDEGDFNDLGYQLLQAGNLESAVFVFEKGVQLYPDSWNAHDSLGEALVKAGRKEEAIQHYRKSLELNPRNQGAKKILEEFGGASRPVK
jgi:tetratricopeptide (TPR) repeat protein